MSADCPSPHAHRPRAKRAGFALLITLTLIAFLVVLLVGLVDGLVIAKGILDLVVVGQCMRGLGAQLSRRLALGKAVVVEAILGDEARGGRGNARPHLLVSEVVVPGHDRVARGGGAGRAAMPLS